jgi:hypothetical protein
VNSIIPDLLRRIEAIERRLGMREIDETRADCACGSLGTIMARVDGEDRLYCARCWQGGP